MGASQQMNTFKKRKCSLATFNRETLPCLKKNPFQNLLSLAQTGKNPSNTSVVLKKKYGKNNMCMLADLFHETINVTNRKRLTRLITSLHFYG